MEICADENGKLILGVLYAFVRSYPKGPDLRSTSCFITDGLEFIEEETIQPISFCLPYPLDFLVGPP